MEKNNKMIILIALNAFFTINTLKIPTFIALHTSFDNGPASFSINQEILLCQFCFEENVYPPISHKLLIPRKIPAK